MMSSMSCIVVFVIFALVCQNSSAFQIISTRMASSRISMTSSPDTTSTPLNPITAAKSSISSPFAWALVAMSTAVLPSIVNAAAEATAPSTPAVEKVPLGPPPTDFGLTYFYYNDAEKLVNQMKYAVQLEKGDPNLPAYAQKVKDEMTDFVSYYRRNTGTQGKQSFSLLYTSVNVLAGHYTSYGVKFPVPEKRRKRLLQEFADIEKNLRKKR